MRQTALPSFLIPRSSSLIPYPSQRPDYLERHSLLEFRGVRVAHDEECLRPAVTGMTVGEVAVGAAGLRDQPPADSLLRREIIVESNDMLLLILNVEQQRRDEPEGQLPAEAPGGIRRDE